MAQLAIEAHPIRTKEVIEILEMLGGKNRYHFKGDEDEWFVLNGDIQRSDRLFNEKGFTLEDFLEKYPYKVGDKVNYVKYNDEHSNVYTIQGMQWTGVTINYLLDSSGFSALTKDLQPYKEETMEDKPNLLQQLKDYFDNTPREVIEKEWHEYDKYNEIGPDVIEYLEYVNNIRKPKYPKTYEECAKVLLERASVRNDIGYKGDLIVTLQKLLVCRDAYWKIAGEQMGLGKPWEYDMSKDEFSSAISYQYGYILKCEIRHQNKILIFPTKEMRDAFYENFKELIELVKELL